MPYIKKALKLGLAYHIMNGQSIVTGFRHRTFAEFLIAYYVTSEIQGEPSGTTTIRVLSPLFNYDRAIQ